jgi:hypothetical protein
MKGKRMKVRLSSKDAFSSVAFWQLMCFVLLLCFVWASEVLDIPRLMFDAESTPFNLYRACVLSAAVITAGIVSVGHTYERQKAIIGRMLMTCVYCHRVMHDDGTWEHVEEYFVRNYPMEVDHGACPSCEAMLASVGDKKDVKDS